MHTVLQTAYRYIKGSMQRMDVQKHAQSSDPNITTNRLTAWQSRNNDTGEETTNAADGMSDQGELDSFFLFYLIRYPQWDQRSFLSQSWLRENPQFAIQHHAAGFTQQNTQQLQSWKLNGRVYSKTQICSEKCWKEGGLFVCLNPTQQLWRADLDSSWMSVWTVLYTGRKVLQQVGLRTRMCLLCALKLF